MKEITIEQIKATIKVSELRKIMTDDKLSLKLGLTKKTIYKKLKSDNWRDSEILIIEYWYNENFKKTVDNLRILKDKNY